MFQIKIEVYHRNTVGLGVTNEKGEKKKTKLYKAFTGFIKFKT